MRSLLAPPIGSFTAVTFAEHVGKLKRSAPRKASKPRSAPKLPALKLKRASAETLELSAGNALFVLPYESKRSGRKLVKSIDPSYLAPAARQLLRPEDALRALLRSKSILIKGELADAEPIVLAV